MVGVKGLWGGRGQGVGVGWLGWWGQGSRGGRIGGVGVKG